MPSINLRLTDEQHADLLEAARRENRSLQREIIYRCFGRFNLGALSEREHGEPDPGERAPRSAPEPLADPDASRSESDRHFKPDPKPGKQK